MEKQPNSRMCFPCSIENPIGFKLDFYTDDDGRCITHLHPGPEHQGYPGYLHGGLVSVLLGVSTQISIRCGVLTACLSIAAPRGNKKQRA